MDMQNYTTPFANTGNREEFSIDTDPSGKVSLEKGWTELYQLRPEEGGLFILRKVFNQMMKLVSTDTVTWKTQTFPNWIDDKGDGLPYSYPKNALVKYTNGNIYVSLANNNTQIPTGANWKLFDITSLVNKDYVDNFFALKTIASGTATFNATTNNINLTGIGIGVEIGDVIQISGAEDAKNNSEFTIEVITNNNNIIVNQAHANKGTSKNVANRSGDTGVTVKLLAKWYNASDDLGRNWVDMTSSRAQNTAYPKPINRALSIAIEVRNPGSSNFAIRVLNGTTKVHFTNINTKENSPYFTTCANITGTTYTVDGLINGSIISSWLELR